MSPSVPRKRDTETIVIGAGAAGISAAKTLVDAGRDVLVLEAQREIGGRILTINGIEHGAEFIHGMTEKFRQLLVRYGLHAEPYHPENAYAFVDGRLCHVNELPTSCTKIIDQLRYDARKLLAQGKDDLTMAAFFRSKMESHPEWQPMERLIRRAIMSEFGAPLHDLSLRGFNDPTTYDDHNYRIREGYSALLKRMAEGIDIESATPVHKIDWERGHAEVWNGERSHNARHVIVTVPLGTMQEGKPAFDPPLPDERISAIRKLGAGQVWKIIVGVDEPVWETDMELLMTTLPTQVWWPSIKGNGDGAALLALVGGLDATQLHHSIERATMRAIKDFRKMFGSKARDAIKSITAIEWSERDHIRSGYSFVPPRATRARQTIAQPLDDTIFFAGEATSTTWPGTVHGALESGERAAYEIINKKLPTYPPASSPGISSALPSIHQSQYPSQ